jgi:two-component system, OmpR family, response regulator
MSVDFSQLRILVVDDQLLVRTLLSQVLRTLGFRPDCISQATDGNNALHVLAARRYDIILCDIQMDPINGMDLLKEVRCARTPNPPDVPYVFLSAHPERTTITLAAQFHADGFIVKPPKPNDIEKNITAAMMRKRPPIDPFHYLEIVTGSDYDLRNFERVMIPKQSQDLDLLLERFHRIQPITDIAPGSILAQDLHAADGRFLLPRGVKISKVHLDTLRKFQQQYGVTSIAIANLPDDQLNLYHQKHVDNVG